MHVANQYQWTAWLCCRWLVKKGALYGWDFRQEYTRPMVSGYAGRRL